MNSKQPRNVIVTGGGTGMGKEIARIFSQNGDRVVIIGRRENVLRQTAMNIGGNVVWQTADVSQRTEVETAVSNIVEKYGTINVLVNNAGFVEGTTTDMPLVEVEQLWDSVINTNLKGCFLMAVAVAPYLTRANGRIINISSIAAFTGGSRPGAIAYAAAKSGVHGMTYSLARELSPQGITVNAIAPGFIANTEFTGHWPDTRVQSIVAQTPVGRPGKGQDVAAATFYLASPEASFITGEVLNVNGGWLFGH